MKNRVCANQDCDEVFAQYNSLQKYCSHFCKMKDVKDKPVAIKPVSDKRAAELAIYRPLRDKYLKDNPVCEVQDCFNGTTNLHHQNGRIGKMIYNTEYFMACCSHCHPTRIHENPEWARSMGYLI